LSSRTGWTTTVLQAAPRLVELVRHLRPTEHLAHVRAVDEKFLATHSVSAILWDVDGTLMPHHDRAVDSDIRAVLDVLGRSVPQAVVSNCDDERLLELGVLFGSSGMSCAAGFRRRSISPRAFRRRRNRQASKTPRSPKASAPRKTSSKSKRPRG
jgi:hypothetical protein